MWRTVEKSLNAFCAAPRLFAQQRLNEKKIRRESSFLTGVPVVSTDAATRRGGTRRGMMYEFL